MYVQKVPTLEQMHSNDYATAQLLPRWWSGPPLPKQMFGQLLYIMDLRTVDPVLKETPDAVVHWIQIRRIG